MPSNEHIVTAGQNEGTFDPTNTNSSAGQRDLGNDSGYGQKKADNSLHLAAILVPLLIIMLMATGVTVPVLALLYCYWKKHSGVNQSSPNNDANDACSISSDAVYIELSGVHIQSTTTAHGHAYGRGVPGTHPVSQPREYEVPTPIPYTDPIPMPQAGDYEVPTPFGSSYETHSASQQSINEEHVTGYLTILP